MTALCGGTQASRSIGARHLAGAGAGGGWRGHRCGDRCDGVSFCCCQLPENS
ncbi:hypothetical protein BU14_0021s0051 [Porphyra umbilicalis]|uniref:Uncharacterized protein n=1 Tax=Porphyra umbilicalis TaxID=2786 RepID=A0A1X6PKZ4_PORUM|nr:hypothetical protein BU14_0021s0051 [Porphyra umbilicalis]|eukprot:OSX81446.1 hypothetical protein BU14_0021s0051 [Porphyra umbilicalis]